MNRKGFLAWGLMLALVGIANAMEGGLDRSVEVARYLPVIQSGHLGDAALVARRIYTSGLSDPTLAAAVNTRLLAEDPTLTTDRPAKEFSVFMVKALASIGNVEYGETLRQLAQKSRNSKVRSTCKDELPMLDWYRQKNAITADATGHSPGEDPAIAGLANLLRDDDYSYKHWAAERMYWDRVFDPLLMQAIAPQLQQFVERFRRPGNDQEEDTLALFVRLLGYSKDTRYNDVLKSVAAAPNASFNMRKYAKAAQEIIRKAQLT